MPSVKIVCDCAAQQFGCLPTDKDLCWKLTACESMWFISCLVIIERETDLHHSDGRAMVIEGLVHAQHFWKSVPSDPENWLEHEGILVKLLKCPNWRMLVKIVVHVIGKFHNSTQMTAYTKCLQLQTCISMKFNIELMKCAVSQLVFDSSLDFQCLHVPWNIEAHISHLSRWN